jgi:hypothetical protein
MRSGRQLLLAMAPARSKVRPRVVFFHIGRLAASDESRVPEVPGGRVLVGMTKSIGSGFHCYIFSNGFEPLNRNFLAILFPFSRLSRIDCNN